MILSEPTCKSSNTILKSRNRVCSESLPNHPNKKACMSKLKSQSHVDCFFCLFYHGMVLESERVNQYFYQ